MQVGKVYRCTKDIHTEGVVCILCASVFMCNHKHTHTREIQPACMVCVFVHMR